MVNLGIDVAFDLDDDPNRLELVCLWDWAYRLNQDVETIRRPNDDFTIEDDALGLQITPQLGGDPVGYGVLLLWRRPLFSNSTIWCLSAGSFWSRIASTDGL